MMMRDERNYRECIERSWKLRLWKLIRRGEERSDEERRKKKRKWKQGDIEQ